MRQARETRASMHGDMKEKMEARFKEADANSDGQISLDEAQAKMPRVAERFSTLDTDKNGLLSKEELKNGAHHRQPQPQS
jgi:Ca2+-binding EF-hand superfamily protein